MLYCYMVKLLNHFYEKEKTSQKSTQACSQREISDSPGSFEFERTRKINQGDLSKIC